MLLKLEGLIFIDQQKMENDGVEAEKYFGELQKGGLGGVSKQITEVVNGTDDYMQMSRLKIETVKSEQLLELMKDIIEDEFLGDERKEEADSYYED